MKHSKNDNHNKIDDNNFQLYFESLPTSIIISNEDGKIIYVNTQSEKMFGYSSNQLLGQQIEILIPNSRRNKHIRYRNKFFKNHENRPMGKGRDLLARRKDGSEFPAEIGLTPIKLEEEIVVLATILDITYRKESEELIRESEKKLQAIIDNSPDSVLVFDQDGSIININNEVKNLFLNNSKKLENILDIVPIEKKPIFLNRLKHVKENQKLSDWETEKILGNGVRIPVSVGLVYVDENDGMYIETIRDIRERVVLRNKIVEYEKAQIIAKMAEGVAHHMGTPLASMLLRIQMLKEDVSEMQGSQELQKKLESVEKQIFYGNKVMQRLLKFSSNPENVKKPVQISFLINESAEIIRPLCNKPSIKLQLNLNKDVLVFADSDMLSLVFSDIMINAIDAMPGGGKLYLKVSTNIKNSGFAKITISDTGTGITKDVIPLVFEPFFTTKPAGKGTGLGLAVAKRIIHDHDGEITIESTKGKGTTVKILIPTYTKEKKSKYV